MSFVMFPFGGYSSMREVFRKIKRFDKITACSEQFWNLVYLIDLTFISRVVNTFLKCDDRRTAL